MVFFCIAHDHVPLVNDSEHQSDRLCIILSKIKFCEIDIQVQIYCLLWSKCITLELLNFYWSVTGMHHGSEEFEVLPLEGTPVHSWVVADLPGGSDLPISGWVWVERNYDVGRIISVGDLGSFGIWKPNIVCLHLALFQALLVLLVLSLGFGNEVTDLVHNFVFGVFDLLWFKLGTQLVMVDIRSQLNVFSFQRTLNCD